MSYTDLSETIEVYCRLRPTEDALAKYNVDQSFEKSTLSLYRPKNLESGYINNTIENYNFAFNAVFDTNVDQDEVFERCAKQCVLTALQGYNSTIFAYGQTGSGKTYTMTGEDDYEKRGIIPRAISLLFEEIEKSKEREFNISLSYLEIYKGHGYDLLDRQRGIKPMSELPKVSIRTDSDGNIVLINLNSVRVRTDEDALDKLFIGDKNRILSETSMNDQSTRSHCIFTLQIESSEPGSSLVRASKLHLVDLAGSERVYKTNATGELLDEAKTINGSLFFLERFIKHVSENAEFIPYRESLITCVLRDSIGGNCKTIMIANINPSYKHINESVSTCKFAMRVASIKQKPTVNEVIDPHVQIKQLKKRIEQLEEELKYYKGEGNNRDSLDLNEISVIKQRVMEFIDDPEKDANLNLGGDHLRIREAFSLFKAIILESKKGGNYTIPTKEESKPIAPTTTKVDKVIENSTVTEDIKEKLKNLMVAVELRDIEIDILVSMLNKKQKAMSEVSIQTEPSIPEPSLPRFSLNNSNPTTFSSTRIESPKPNQSLERKPREIITKEQIKDKLKEKENEILSRKGDEAPSYSNDKIAIVANAVGMKERAEAFEIFRRTYRKDNVIERNKQILGEKIILAKELAKVINDKKAEINALKNKLTQLRTERATQNLIKRNEDNEDEEDEEQYPEEIELKKKILFEKDEHQKKFDQLKEYKKEIEYLKRVLDNSREKLKRDFENWYKTTDVKSTIATFKSEEMDEETIVNSYSPRTFSSATLSSNTEISSLPQTNSLLSTSNSFLPEQSRLIKQAWLENEVSNDSVNSLPNYKQSSTLKLSSNINNSNKLNTENLFSKRIRQHMDNKDNNTSTISSSTTSSRPSLIQQAYKLA
ncbi:hypothetical protein ABK040_005332 [Willaertia magna]